MKSLTYVLIAIPLLFFSCGSSEKTQQESTTQVQEDKTTEKQVVDANKMQAEGFQMGVIKAGKGEGSCDYIIDIKGGFAAQKVDPIDLPKEYKQDDQKIWVKFTSLRRSNRCPEARPVEITSIHKRVE